MKEYKASVFDPEKNELGESPFYDERFRRYSWVDITQGRLWTLKDGKKACFELGQPIGAAVPMSDSDGFLLAATDGLCIDAEDNLWVAYWGGHRIEKRSGADGRKLGEIRLPAVNVTSCAIAEGGKKLFITSSGLDQDGETDGCLFICDIS